MGDKIWESMIFGGGFQVASELVLVLRYCHRQLT